MNKKQIQEEIARRLGQGESKSAVYRALSGGEVKDNQVAHLIATHADPRLTEQHAGLVKALVIISWGQLFLAAVVVLANGGKLGLGITLVLLAFTGAFGYLFIWGYKHHKAWAYTVSIFLSCTNLPKAFTDFSADPITSIVAFVLGLAVLVFTWHVRSRLFPDLYLVGPKKVSGSFVFSS